MRGKNRESFSLNFKLIMNSPLGFNNNNFNERGGNFQDRDRESSQSRGRGGRNWREDEAGERSSFSRGSGNTERKSSRWMDTQKNDDEWDATEQQQQPPQSQTPTEQQEQGSSLNDNGNREGEGDYQHELPPGTELNEEPANEPVAIEANETFDNHRQEDSNIEPTSADSGGIDEDNPGNTTPLCDEAESKE